MRFIKRVVHYLALLLAGGFFGCGVSTMCALLSSALSSFLRLRSVLRNLLFLSSTGRRNPVEREKEDWKGE